MNQISEHVYIEDEFPGVVLGALNFSHGLVMVDAPFQSKDITAWRGRLANLGGGVDKLLVVLDNQIDRCYGARGMGANILCHQKSVEIFQSRASVSHIQEEKTGAELDVLSFPLEAHSPTPDFTYSDKAAIYWNGDPLLITHHPGSHVAGSWLLYEPEKVVFVGDSVVINQPPFFAWSDLDYWLDDLYLLTSDAFADYKIISSRNGLVDQQGINGMIEFLHNVRGALQELRDSNIKDVVFQNVIARLLNHFDFDQNLYERYTQRLGWGLTKYLQRHPILEDQENK